MDIALFVIGAVVVTAFGIKLFQDSNKPASGVRARNDKGHYIKDDPTTAKNEAYKDGKTPPVKKAPVKRKPAAKKPVAKKAPAKRSRKQTANKK
jgi:hypothetical protein|tara:strand:- start:101 stop:382 length:282 start_codon:yes stop_codon:yes gene_type:complete